MQTVKAPDIAGMLARAAQCGIEAEIGAIDRHQFVNRISSDNAAAEAAP